MTGAGLTAAPGRADPAPTRAAGTPAAEPSRVVAGVPALLLRRPELLVAAGLFVVLLATAGRYGWFNDELYFIRAGQEPAWAYADQPFLNPVLLSLLHDLTGGHLVAVRAVAALASCACVVLVGSMAGSMGAGAAGRATAAGLWAGTGSALVNGHVFVTGTFDLLASAAMCWCLVRAIATRDPRWVAVAGLALGFGLTNKMLVGALAGCLALALLLVGPRWVLRSRWTVIGAVPAVLAAAPYVYFQATHGWPQSSVAASISTLAETRPPGQLLAQLTMLSVPAVALWVGGVVHLFRTERLRPFRFFAVGYLLLLVSVLVLHGRGYYTNGVGPVLAALGGLAGEAWLRRGRAGRSTRVRRAAVAATLGVALAVGVVFSLPVIPAARLEASGVGRLNPMLIDEVGWRRVAETVAEVHRSVPTAQRDETVVLTTSYASAGAVDVYGPDLGLPRAFSGHNGYGAWGPPTGDGPVILVGFESPAAVSGAFRGCRPAAVTDNGLGLTNSTQGLPVLLCAGPLRPWPELWPELVHHDLGLDRTLPGAGSS
ncbi:glycosyltransferase family 39 protein [Cellulomonas shaoxiangyii]|uniref:Glycosyltransferase RgtA/B/C/D-like domain-containing protein n=1 Tax=Cellulomonas shaoxiangyii TaxID=2566013 RepID=A0A4V1CN30_9CELL|nr:glycosyltransferase family 39 protein [Cellulomonas shaoxiangyii]QCB95015.1 hypothetical protein E5225_17045 [Cellulomonas shaoxiangyii]TGY86344.1 hypothetical protein E5226_02130 [Cellulomonas shaoxiangyii]